MQTEESPALLALLAPYTGWTSLTYPGSSYPFIADRSRTTDGTLGIPRKHTTVSDLTDGYRTGIHTGCRRDKGTQCAI